MSGFQWDSERQDIQLAHDQSKSQARENRIKDQMRFINLPILEYGSEGSDATPITEIVKKMIQEDQMRSLWFNNQIIWDVDTIHDAVDEACISLGISNEDYAPYCSASSDQIEICLQ